ncbi:hypothetical protein, variant 1 [Phytophthora nicotianae CJ01A1]|uniref:Peptidase S54 rhomboid domain-containing protein n=12 Tax=Phytophthora nicotianae TaxID=4792 RepID=W2QEM0_PHYN3|nr:hypothetical protein, variant 1 [Phytophthora nicotianae INRA-310]ETI50980.1 hypothetical protein, variant 1 [Phytophthora nicotianae P1569]ETK90836.1 hypothetical protein, variant 1 [Phytophthora nicotianae]ETO79668.1 hypothetical protein F444_05649 [Phytophthora nicotianae P1976]ETP20747.1 hypothetical protein, variant 1 [Phytophthora nicotianae CJ01A1]ETP48690.1 hypothetical protein, variant 1 [Phytophthora nicotianae P10297]
MRLPVSVGLVLSMVLLWLVGAMFTPAEEKGGILALSVADVILRHIRPWVYLTAGFYHPYIVQLVFVLPLAFGLAKRVEPDLGALNLVRLLLFANTAAAVVMFVNLFILYIIFRNPIYLEASFSGFTGGIAALLVAYMKPTPFATAPLFPGVPLRFYPLVACIVFCFCTMAGMAFTAVPAVSLMLVSAGPFSVLGGYFGWYYLRFLNKNRDQTVGDVSDEFALVVLLPDFCIPLVSPLANFCFSVVKLCGFFKKRAAQKPKMLPILTEIKNDPIAERRKARAMKALDEKLAKLAHARDDTGASSLLSVEVRDDEN